MNKNSIYGESPLKDMFEKIDSHGDVLKKGCFGKSIKRFKYLLLSSHLRTRKIKGSKFARPFIAPTIQPISANSSIIDLQLMEMMHSTTRDIYASLGVPKNLIGLDTNSSYENLNQAFNQINNEKKTS